MRDFDADLGQSDLTFLSGDPYNYDWDYPYWADELFSH